MAAEDTFVAADILVADILTAKADGADTADSALNPLTVAEVADTLPAKAEVELRSVNLPDTPLIAAEDTLVAAEILVADIVGAKDEVELKLVNLPETPLIAAEDTLVAADMFVAEIFCINADGADTADNALSPLTVAEVAETLVAYEDGADTADNALNPLINPDVPDRVTPLVVVPLRSVAVQVVVLIFCINAEGADTEDNALILLTVAEVPESLNPFTSSLLTILVAEIF